ncbi:hypothetical protein TIFTF001_038315 [Ficus carica]|uniref:Uncharacterized protein n=1 Tax=Ficus carica TaxID=3494 RepID=A0AA88JCY1_FICCA|nr:hypothetical protein TIFTF001_038303 [Ficus carica]GMN69258.1 hypothetical protein TIFTF001_038306 [Ficus carica]GMN69260.1 hypothetical protein TIFTF001_038312 [Ficus carica]GMN69267.1 hypothetical protein TIFTF001_038315 [Ficus carica]
MRGKTKVEQWDHALMQLRRSKPQIRGVEEKVFSPLKWSYDSLKDENTKACFLYCALFPEDFSIEISELVQCWTAEGFIDEHLNSDNSTYVNGIVMVETLKDSCLLEDGARRGTIKMHDVVRDVAIWIASLLEDGLKSLVCSGINLSEISKSVFSNSLKRVSFMNNKISELPDCEIQGSEVSTLLLQGNHQLEIVPERFLQSFPALRVLNISKSRIQSLPPSLLHLSDLRALLLGNCILLEMLPLLGMLSQLQILDLTATCISELPKEMGNLIYLRQVKLSHSTQLRSIAAGIVSKWTCLEVLDMAHSSYTWGARGEVEEGQATFEELGCLKQLVMLSINLKSIPWMVSVILSSMHRLRKFQFFIGDGAINFPNNHDEQMVTISRLNLSMERVRWFLANASSLVLNKCSLKEMVQELAVSSVCHSERNNAGIFEGLRLLTITGSNFASKPNGGCVSPHDIFPNLEELHLHNLNSLESISELFGHLGLTYSKLKLIEVSSCPDMKCLLYYGCFILSLPILETIKVSSCIKLEHLFNYTSEQSSGENPAVVPKLRILELKNLTELATLCGRKETWPCLERVFVVQCCQLTNLPLSVRNANTIKEIKGEPTWWSGLRWDDEDTKLALQPRYRPIGFWRQDTGRF